MSREERMNDVNDVLFSLYEKGFSTGGLAMLNLMMKLELIGEPIKELIKSAIRHDAIQITTEKNELKTFINEKQGEITTLYKEMFGIK